MFKSYGKKKRIFLIVNFIAYLFCVLFLIVEASLPGTISANQSDAIGGGIADIIDKNAGDQSVLVKPEKINLNKEKDSLFVGETYQLKATILPEDCSFQSLSYESSDEEVLSVDEQGKVEGIKAGTAFITCYSTSYPSIKDTMSFTVSNIVETSISSSVSDAEKDKEGVYLLTMGSSYPIKTVFDPEDTTIKELSYSVSSTAISIKEDVIYADSLSSHPITITITSKQGKQSQVRVRVVEDSKDVIPLTKITIKQEAYTQSVGEKVSTKSDGVYAISFEPSNATYKTYDLVIADTSIASVQGTAIQGLKEGKTTLKVVSAKYPSITATREITIGLVELNSVGSILLGGSSSPSFFVGDSSYLSYQNPLPGNASAIKGKKEEHISFESSNPEVASVDKTGKVTATGEGKCTLIRKFYDRKEDKESGNNYAVKKEIEVTCRKRGQISSFSLSDTINESKDASQKVLYLGKSYSLKNGLKAKAFYDGKGNVRQDVSSSLSYAVDSVSPNSLSSSVSFNGDNLLVTGDTPLEITIKVTHPSSSLSQYLAYKVIHPREITLSREGETESGNDTFDGENYPLFSTSTSFSVGTDLSIKRNASESYSFTFEKEKDHLYSRTDRNTTNGFSIRGMDEGERKVLITPSFQGTPLEGRSKILKIKIFRPLIQSMNIRLYKNGKEIPLQDYTDSAGKISLTLTKGDKINYQLIKEPEKYIKENISVENSNPQSLQLQNNRIIRKEVGESTIKWVDSYSRITLTLKLLCVNRVLLQDKPFTLSQSKLTYDKEENIYHIENGTPARITTNFKKGSTFTKVSYSSSDENVLQVGDDGKITPLKEGKATITCSINDHHTIDQFYQVTIAVDKKSIISNRRSFLLKVRKGIGHLGAFFVLGVFSTLLSLFAVKKKKEYCLSIPLNFLQGFLVAGLTELIQLAVPGRTGLFSDVLIDRIGFAISAVAITLCFFLIPLIKNWISSLRTKKKE